MTRPLILLPIVFASALFVSTPAAAEPAERAVASCRTEMLSQFPAGSIRSYRVTSIEGNSRNTRVTISVTADQRYTFECAAGARGQVVTASVNPPRTGAQLASGQR